MKICIVAEGCYPYVVGGVSSWIQSLIKTFPEYDFIVLAIVANRNMRGKFVYEFPENVLEVHEVYLEDVEWRNDTRRHKNYRLNKKEFNALRTLLLNQNVDWDTLFQMFIKRDISLNELLMGEDFFQAAKQCYQLRFSEIVFSDYLWTLRSIYLPLFLALKTPLPKADLYHCVATGYAGVLGCKAKYQYQCGLMISEHGIYSREREEEILKANWVKGIYKSIWIEQFHKMSLAAYRQADVVTSLFEHAKELQLELGCPQEKVHVVPNGIDVSRYAELSQELNPNPEMVHIGAVLRVTPIKDVKTLLRAFAYAKQQCPNICLWVMGNVDEDPDYARECFELVEHLGVQDVVFTGRINVTEYLGWMDITILTSISEGQPLTILESYAAHKPAIATDVGNCKGLLYGEGDSYGEAGILTHIMNVREIGAAIVDLVRDPEKRRKMGENGYQRVLLKYQLSQMKRTYLRLYDSLEQISE